MDQGGRLRNQKKNIWTIQSCVVCKEDTNQLANCCIFMRASHTSLLLLEHPTSSVPCLISILTGSDTYLPGLPTLHPRLDNSDIESWRLTVCCLSNGIPQQLKSPFLTHSPVLLEIVANWLVRHHFSQATSFLFIHQPSNPFVAICLNQHNTEVWVVRAIWGAQALRSVFSLQCKAAEIAGAAVSHCNKDQCSCLD